MKIHFTLIFHQIKDPLAYTVKRLEIIQIYKYKNSWIKVKDLIWISLFPVLF